MLLCEEAATNESTVTLDGILDGHAREQLMSVFRTV